MCCDSTVCCLVVLCTVYCTGGSFISHEHPLFSLRFHVLDAVPWQRLWVRRVMRLALCGATAAVRHGSPFLACTSQVSEPQGPLPQRRVRLNGPPPRMLWSQNPRASHLQWRSFEYLLCAGSKQVASYHPRSQSAITRRSGPECTEAPFVSIRVSEHFLSREVLFACGVWSIHLHS